MSRFLVGFYLITASVVFITSCDSVEVHREGYSLVKEQFEFEGRLYSLNDQLEIVGSRILVGFLPQTKIGDYDIGYQGPFKLKVSVSGSPQADISIHSLKIINPQTGESIEEWDESGAQGIRLKSFNDAEYFRHIFHSQLDLGQQELVVLLDVVMSTNNKERREVIVYKFRYTVEDFIQKVYLITV